MRRIFLFFCFYVVYAISVSAQTYVTHTVRKGETLYGIAQAFGTTVSDIQNINPILNGDYVIKIGESLKIHFSSTNSDVIPDCKQKYVAQKKETIYGIAKRFNITEDELVAANPVLKGKPLKKNMELCIPYNQSEKLAMQQDIAEKQAKLAQQMKPKPVKVAVILPFDLSHKKKDKEACTMIDFYEGFLMGVKELKMKGISTEVYTYDETNIYEILAEKELQSMDLIVGPKDTENISTVARFCSSNKISLIVPFSSQEDIVNNKQNIYQVNAKIQMYYSAIFQELYNQSHNAEYVFVSIGDNNQQDFTNKFSNFLAEHNATVKQVSIDSLKNTGVVNSSNTIIIPTSNSKSAFESLINQLEKIPSTGHIRIVGYPNWQTFANYYPARFSKYQCMFFTSFYNNPNSSESIAFNNQFKSCFKRDQFNTYPRFGMLGYDVAKYFIGNQWTYRDQFSTCQSKINTKSLQNPMHFIKKNDWSGFVNSALMSVMYNADGSVSVKQF